MLHIIAFITALKCAHQSTMRSCYAIRRKSRSKINCLKIDLPKRILVFESFHGDRKNPQRRNTIRSFECSFFQLSPHLPNSSRIVLILGNAFIWFPSARTFVSTGPKITSFLDGRFLTVFGRLPLWRCVSLRFHVFWRPPVHFGDLELTGTKKRLL